MEITNIETILVAENDNVLFTETPIEPSACIKHRDGAGVVTLRGITNQARARFMVSYSGNISIPTGGSIEAISLAISLNGEPLQATQMVVTPAAVGEAFNVSASAFVDVPRACCTFVAVKNTSSQAINVANSNLIVTREA